MWLSYSKNIKETCGWNRGSGEKTSRNCEQTEGKQEVFLAVQGFGFYTEQNGDPLEGWIRLNDTYWLMIFF